MGLETGGCLAMSASLSEQLTGQFIPNMQCTNGCGVYTNQLGGIMNLNKCPFYRKGVGPNDATFEAIILPSKKSWSE